MKTFKIIYRTKKCGQQEFVAIRHGKTSTEALDAFIKDFPINDECQLIKIEDQNRFSRSKKGKP